MIGGIEMAVIYCFSSTGNSLYVAKGYYLNYGKAIKAVENYTVSYKVDDTQKVEDNLQNKLGTICTEIKN